MAYGQEKTRSKVEKVEDDIVPQLASTIGSFPPTEVVPMTRFAG
jgi:hypothetical protein